MSENAAPDMSGEKDVTPVFYDALTKSLEDCMSAGDSNGCLEIIKFVRRFVQDVPVTEYRTVGFPTSISKFLDACGLKCGTDYHVDASSLDKGSHVLSFSKTDKTYKALGHIAGLRVSKGPSVCERLYCEMCKDSGRDFVKALSDAVPSSNACTVSDYVLKHSAKVYVSLSDFLQSHEESDLDAKSVEVLKYAANQVSKGKILPSAPPIVPAAVAELYYLIFGKGQNGRQLFMLGKDPGSWVSARPMLLSGKFPSAAVGYTPVQVLREADPTFSGYMPDDAGSFDAASKTASPPDSILALVSAPMRFPGETIDETVEVFNMSCKRAALFSLLEEYYKTCYPDLSIAFYHTSGTALPTSSEHADRQNALGTRTFRKAEEDADAALGITAPEGGTSFSIVMTSAFVLSPYVASCKTASNFMNMLTSNICIRMADKGARKAKAPESNVADLWFKTVHAAAAPKLKEAECAEKMEKYLKSVIKETEDGEVPMAIATGVRSALYQKAESYMDSRRMAALDFSKVIEGADKEGLHTPSKCVTQVISTVSGLSKSLSQFMTQVQDGVNAPSAPSALAGSLASCPANTVSKFIELAASTGLQIRMPRKVCDFNIYAETNLKYSAIEQMAQSCSDLSGCIERRVASELMNVFLANSFGPDGIILKREKDVVKAFGARSPVVRLMSNVCDLSENDVTSAAKYVASGNVDVAITGDKHDRAFVAIRLNFSAAALAILARSDEAEFDAVLQALARHNPSVITVGEDWHEEVYSALMDGAGKMTTVAHALHCLENVGHSRVKALQSTAGFFTQDIVSPEFRHMAVCNSGRIDPN